MTVFRPLLLSAVVLAAAGCVTTPAPADPMDAVAAETKDTPVASAAPAEPAAPAAPAEPAAPPAPTEAATPTDAGAAAEPAADAAADTDAEPAPGAEIPGQREHGGWVAPEVLAVVDRLKTSGTNPSRVVYLGGPSAPYCMDVYRFRLEFGAEDRFVELGGFKKASDVKDCQKNFREQHRSSWKSTEALQSIQGTFFVVFSPALGRDSGIKKQVLTAVSAAPAKKATKIPKKVVPAGAVPEEIVRDRLPPPITRKPVGRKGALPERPADLPPATPMR